MKVIYKERGKGKTEELIKQSAKNGGYIVCQSMTLAEGILYRARKLGLKIPTPITYREFLDGRYCGRGIKSFLIDDADMLLQYMTNVKIEAITMTENIQEKDSDEKEEKLDKNAIQADIRNRLNPITNLIAMCEGVSKNGGFGAMTNMFEKEIKQCKTEIDRLSNYFKEEEKKSMLDLLEQKYDEASLSVNEFLTKDYCFFINEKTYKKLKFEFSYFFLTNNIDTFNGVKIRIDNNLKDNEVVIFKKQ